MMHADDCLPEKTPEGVCTGVGAAARVAGVLVGTQRRGADVWTNGWRDSLLPPRSARSSHCSVCVCVCVCVCVGWC